MRSPKILIPAVAAVAVVAAFYFLVLSPKRDEAATLDGKIATQQQQVDQSKALLASYEDAKARYKKNYATVARLGKAVPADDDVRSLLVQLNSAAVKSGVTSTRSPSATTVAARRRPRSPPASSLPRPARCRSAAPASRRCRSASASRARFFKPVRLLRPARGLRVGAEQAAST